jgi:hypothetical protein
MKINLTAPTNWMRLACDLLPPDFRCIKCWTVTLCLVAVGLAARPSRAQETPRVEVFGGYSLTDFDSKTLGHTGNSALNGGTLMVAGNVTRNFGVLAEGTLSFGSGINLRDILFGPQFLLPHGNFLFFAHGLFGRARSSVQTGVEPEPLDTQNALAFGGGIDMNFRHHLAIRLFQVDYLHTSVFQHDQNNLRIATGVVYQWHTIRRRPHRAPSIPTP